MKTQVLIWLLSVVFSSFASASLTEDFSIFAQKDQKVLKIQISETESVGNQCDLVVTRFDFFSDLNLINVEIKETDFCPADFVGPRKALVLWQLPQRLRTAGLLNLRLNGKILNNIKLNDAKEVGP